MRARFSSCCRSTGSTARRSTRPWTRYATASARRRSPVACSLDATPGSRCRCCRIEWGRERLRFNPALRRACRPRTRRRAPRRAGSPPFPRVRPSLRRAARPTTIARQPGRGAEQPEDPAHGEPATDEEHEGEHPEPQRRLRRSAVSSCCSISDMFASPSRSLGRFAPVVPDGRGGARPPTRGACPECVPGAVTDHARPSPRTSRPVYARAMGTTATAGVARRRGSRLATARLGWIVFAATSAALLAAVVLDLRAGSYGAFLYLAVAGVLALIGVLLTTRRPDHRIAWVLALTAGWWVGGGLMHAYAVEALVATPGSLPGGLAVAWADNWWWLPGSSCRSASCSAHAGRPPGLPRGGGPSSRSSRSGRHWRPSPFRRAHVRARPGRDDREPARPRHARRSRRSGSWAPVWSSPGSSPPLVAFVVRFRRSRDEERQQLRWVGVSLGFAVPLFLVGARSGASFLVRRCCLPWRFSRLPTGIAIAILNTASTRSTWSSIVRSSTGR